VNATLKKTLWVVGFLAVCAIALAIRLNYVHNESGEWRMRPSAEPRILRYDGHVYDRAGYGFVKKAGYFKHGMDLGGGYLFVPEKHGVPREIQVHNLRRYYDYDLTR